MAATVERGAISSRQDLERLKRETAVAYSLGRYLSNSEILGCLSAESRESLGSLFRVHPRRSASGIVVVTAFSAPYSCPHGTCVFCPGGPRSGTPQSYLPESPGMKSALEVAFDPYLQVTRSLTNHKANGHGIGKVETIIEGGTFIAVPFGYQESFVKGVYDGLNGRSSSSLEEAQFANETAGSRCVGLTLESKPDWCRPEDIDRMLSYGITRLEIGVQSLRDATLAKSNRGHSVQDTVDAFRTARDAGMKVTAHMMPGLPGATPGDDLSDLRALFQDDRFKPDMTKIYPTLVVPGTALSRMFEAGRFVPYDLDTVVELLSEMKRFVPAWHRIMRIQREIPAHEISAGVRSGNLRQLVLRRVAEKGFECRCIRCREVALGDPDELGERDSLVYKGTRFVASDGVEIFGSFEYESTGMIAGFVRMRLPSDSAHRAEMNGSAVIRELRVYGKALEVGRTDRGAWQHHGLGGRMMAEMTKVARENFGAKRLLVTSAVGTRRYYAKFGFSRSGPYMARRLN